MFKPNWGPIGKEVYERTYSRVKKDGENEDWYDTCVRVVEGNLGFVPKKHHLKGEREELLDLFLNFGGIPAGRHLWVTGIEGRNFISNCHTAGWSDDIVDHYAFTFDELMKGGGVGSNYSNRYIRKYGPVKTKVNVHILCSPEHKDYEKIKPYLSNLYHYNWPGAIRVEDSREGWVDGLAKLLSLSFSDAPRHEVDLVLDVSIVREYGKIIRGFGGVASGPTPLARMLLEVAELLSSRLNSRLSSLDHMLIDHKIACCVVAGNVRRSARMSIKHWKDEDIFDFINCKRDGSRVAHFTTNISVEIDNAFFRAMKRKDEWATSVYQACIDGMIESGEPGFWNSSLSSIGELGEAFCPNPCGEIILNQWENCNLGHINLGYFYNNVQGARRAFKLMARFLIRATFSDIYNKKQREVVDRNRRIGVGFFGFQDWLCKQGIKYSEAHHNHEIRQQLREFYSVVREEARSYCSQLRIPECIKVTTIAPTGTIAKMPGTSEGAQTIYGRYFWRIINYANNDERLLKLIEQGYYHEPSVYNQDTTAVYFLCKDKLVDDVERLGIDPDVVEDQGDLSISDCLSTQAMLQREYADNSISYTINVEPPKSDKEKEKLTKELYHSLLRYLPELKGTTVILGAGGRPQTPYTRITREEYELAKQPKEVSQGSMECKGNSCPVK